MRKYLVSLFFISTISALDLASIKRMYTVATTEAADIQFDIVDPGALLIECSAACDSGWKYWNSSCYQKFNDAGTFANAVTSCEALGAQLVKISSSDENEALRKEFDSNVVVGEAKQTWIGLQYSSGSWQWVADGSTPSFTNWAPTEPSSSASGMCAQMITDTMQKAAYLFERGGWKTYSCDNTSSSYICKKNAN